PQRRRVQEAPRRNQQGCLQRATCGATPVRKLISNDRPPSSGIVAAPYQSALGWVVAASLFLLPLVCDPSGYDAFRYPKFLLFRLTAILIAAILITAALFGKLDVRRLIRKRSRIVMLAAEALLFFVAAWIAVRDSRLNQVIAAPFAAGVINALVAVVQRTNVWSGFP